MLRRNFLILGMLFLVSCASSKPEVTYEYVHEGQCALNVMKGNCTKKGVKKYNVKYRGKTYLFSSEENKDLFLSKLNSNIDQANREWKQYIERRILIER